MFIVHALAKDNRDGFDMFMAADSTITGASFGLQLNVQCLALIDFIFSVFFRHNHCTRPVTRLTLT